MPLRNLEKEQRQPSLVLHLSNAETNNAFGLEMAQVLKSTIETMRPQALVLTHRGPVFCSGGNLKHYASLKSKEEGVRINRQIRDILNWLDELPISKVAVVNGHCFGGGIELLSCFDHIIATPQSMFGLWQRKVGLSFGWGGQKRLQRRLSEQKLSQWLYSAQLKDVYQCQKMGLVDRIALHHQAVAKADQWNQKALQWGVESLEKIQKYDENEAFESLWLSEKHKSVLKKFQ